MGSDSSQVRADALFQDPVRRALVAQPGGHLRKDAARPVAEILPGGVHGLVQAVVPAVDPVTDQRPPAVPVLGIHEVHQACTQAECRQ